MATLVPKMPLTPLPFKVGNTYSFKTIRVSYRQNVAGVHIVKYGPEEQVHICLEGQYPNVVGNFEGDVGKSGTWKLESMDGRNLLFTSKEFAMKASFISPVCEYDGAGRFSRVELYQEGSHSVCRSASAADFVPFTV